MICVSIANTGFEECTELLKKFEMAEIRLDLLNFSKEQIQNIFSLSTIPLIATCRPGNLSEKDRLNKLKLAIESGAKFIDIEYELEEHFRNQIISIAQNNVCEVIISFHNFEDTPHTSFLQSVVNECFFYGADIAKIACMVLDKKDNAKILSLYTSDKRIVAFGMGELGKISRIASLYMGAEFTYAALNEKDATAPGQLTVKQFLKLLNTYTKVKDE